MYPITITGHQVDLRDFRADYIPAAYAVVGDDRVTRWLSYDTRDLAQATTMIEGAIQRAQNESRAEYYLAVTDKTDQMIGSGQRSTSSRIPSARLQGGP